MNADMLLFALTSGLGALVGAVLGCLAIAWWVLTRPEGGSAFPPRSWWRSTASTESAVHRSQLESERSAVASAFEVHASAVARQVSAFADELADGDPVLRERLRRLESNLPGGVR